MITKVSQNDSPKVSTTTADAQSKSETISNSDFAKELGEILHSHDGTNVSEEELFSALVGHQLKKLKGDEAFDKYSSMLGAEAGQAGSSFEEQSISALIKLSDSGELSEIEASKIYSEAFTAAQLDSDSEHLFDHIGGGSDSTKATETIAQGIQKAENIMKLLESGELASPAISIREGESRARAAFSLIGNQFGAKSSSSNHTTDGSGSFLYKPESDSDGNLVVLSNSSFSDQATSARIVKDGAILDEGRWGGIGNGNRAHFRFSKPGSAYPDNLTIEFVLKDGSIKAFEIAESAERNEQ